jgi:Tfp pilus assembly protein PilO
VTLWVMPEQVQRNGTENDLKAAREQKERMEKLPVPSHATDEQLTALMQQVPVQEETARIVRLLQNTAQEAKLTMTAIHFGERDPASSSQLENLITKASQAEQSKALPPSVTSTTSSSSPAAPTPVPASGTGGKETGKPFFTETVMELEISGAYGRTIDFVNQLNKQDRFIRVKEWSLAPVAANAAGDTGSTRASAAASSTATPYKDGGVPVTLKLKVSAYSAPQYADKLTGLPPLEAAPGAQRQDPTWSDSMMWELVKP